MPGDVVGDAPRHGEGIVALQPLAPVVRHPLRIGEQRLEEVGDQRFGELAPAA